VTETIYYLTGRGGQLNTGLGEGLLDRGVSLAGREMSGDFMKLAFQAQLDLISRDLQDSFWHEKAKVIAVSYGAYLLLHVLADLARFPGHILLLSPVLGGFTDAKTMRDFSPPRSKRLMELSGNSDFPNPVKMEVHVGDQDWQSPSQMVIDFCNTVECEHTLVKGKGHELGKGYVGSVLDKWLLS
jgi:hypothetical protein